MVSANLPKAHRILRAVRKALLLSDDLRSAPYKGKSPPSKGHCYIVSEVALVLLGPQWKPMHMWHEGVSHWFLQHRVTGDVLDITRDQFGSKPKYVAAKGKGFLTKHLSRRAQILMTRVSEYIE